MENSPFLPPVFERGFSLFKRSEPCRHLRLNTGTPQFKPAHRNSRQVQPHCPPSKSTRLRQVTSGDMNPSQSLTEAPQRIVHRLPKIQPPKQREPSLWSEVTLLPVATPTATGSRKHPSDGDRTQRPYSPSPLCLIVTTTHVHTGSHRFAAFFLSASIGFSTYLLNGDRIAAAHPGGPRLPR